MSAAHPLRDPFDAGVVGRDDFTMGQPLDRYGDMDHAVWAHLYQRQAALIEGRVCNEFLAGLAQLDLPAHRVPTFSVLNRQLRAATGFEIVAVPGLVPDRVFFEHLANRRFPVTWWMRRPDQLDYLQEPDCFHDLFGHVPLLIHPIFADYMQAYGRAALAFADDSRALPLFARLYWYTVEFGLMRDAAAPNGVRIYGAGIVSSKSETLHSQHSDSPNRIRFSLERVLRTRYRIDTFQKTYFVIDNFRQFFEIAQTDLASLVAKHADSPAFKAGDVLSSDIVITRGTGDGWASENDI